MPEQNNRKMLDEVRNFMRLHYNEKWKALFDPQHLFVYLAHGR
jgi:hypothetical protein